ncbi:MAG TPA: type II secretion system F family protein [Dehalococcoidia bacterium]|nr:type II secretion system F family protein [Dehalococcoidia bacterium]
MDTLVLITSICGALAVFLVSYGAWSLISADRNRVAWRVRRTGIGMRPGIRPSQDVLVQGRSSPIFTPVDRALSKYSWAEKASLELQRAEVNLHLSEFIAFRVLTTLAAFLVLAVIGLATGEVLLLVAAVGLGVFVYWYMGFFVRRRVKRRQDAIEARLDEALVNIAGSLRAGFSFLQACQMSLNQLEWPLKQEIEEMLEEVNVGASLDDALRHLAERIESYEVDIAVNAVLVQRQVGGSLADILDNVARTIRERRELRGHVMALTAQQRLSSYIVAAVPVIMAVFLSLSNWEFMKPLFVTTTGNILLVMGVVLDVLGFVVMRRLTRIDF